ncbi:MAG: ABC transporter substrate-binding protein [Acidobacteriota bacterium]
MNGRVLPAVLLVVLPALLAQQPHYDGRKKELDYPGPGREVPEPEVSEVRIGYFGPSDPSHPLGGDLWLAAQLALEEVNAGGGYRGLPFRLLPAWSENPWGSGISDVTRLVYNQRVWALIGGIDGPSTHLVEQVTTKARLALIGASSTDKTVNYAYVPWMFSMLPADQLQAPLLCARIEDILKGRSGRLAVISANDHDSHLAAREFKSLLARRGVTPSRDVQVRSGNQADIAQAARDLAATRPDAILVVANPIDSAQIVRTLKESKNAARIFGSCAFGRRAFIEAAGTEADGAVFPLLDGESAGQRGFSQKFFARFGRSPDFAAVQTYDAVHLLAQAIRKAGLNRARIRDAIRQLSGWEGANGIVRWDAVGQNTRLLRLGTFQNGQIHVFK